MDSCEKVEVVQYMEVGSMDRHGRGAAPADLRKSGKRWQRNPAADQFNQANHPPPVGIL